MICGKCNTLNSSEAEVCVSCGATLKKNKAFDFEDTSLQGFKENFLDKTDDDFNIGFERTDEIKTEEPTPNEPPISIEKSEIESSNKVEELVFEGKGSSKEKKVDLKSEDFEDVIKDRGFKIDWLQLIKSCINSISNFFSKLKIPKLKLKVPDFDFLPDVNTASLVVIILSVATFVLFMLINYNVITIGAVDNIIEKSTYISDNIVKRNVYVSYTDSLEIAKRDSIRTAFVKDSLNQEKLLKEKKAKERKIVKKLVKKPEIKRYKRNMQKYTSLKDGMLMILIPAGKITVGSKSESVNEQPEHEVYVKAFYIDEHEVTNSQYLKYVESMSVNLPKYFKDSRFNSPEQPVVGVSYQEATGYAKWAGKRLPNEYEWEKAARGGLKNLLYPYSKKVSPKIACYDLDPIKDNPVDVKKYEPNDFKLYDMSGNVAEWTSTKPVAYPGGKLLKEYGNISLYRIIRGGGWKNIKDHITVSHRGVAGVVTQRNDLGFRCVMDY